MCPPISPSSTRRCQRLCLCASPTRKSPKDFLGWRYYVKLIRFKYHISFILVVIGLIFFSHGTNFSLLKLLFVLYISFNVLLYGGLYTLNDIADIQSDARHTLKSKRPLPSGKITIKSATIFSLVLILSSLVIAYLSFSIIIVYIFIIFILLNLIYTFFAKKIAYIELVANSMTYPLRFIMGIILGNGSVPYLFSFALFFGALGLSTARRSSEKMMDGWNARPTLKYYSRPKLLLIKILSFIFIVFFFFLDYPLHRWLYILLIGVYVLAIFGIYFSRYIRGILRTLWLK